MLNDSVADDDVVVVNLWIFSLSLSVCLWGFVLSLFSSMLLLFYFKEISAHVMYKYY
jgi:hypothetical protein